MRRFLQIFLLAAGTAGVANAQQLTVTSPSGLEEPYEVAAGSAVTFQFEFSGAEPTSFFSHTTSPEFLEWGTDPNWTTHNTFKDNGNGTYSLTLTVNGPVYVWSGTYSSFIGWRFTNVVEIGIASGVKLIAANGFLCPTGANSEALSVEGTYASYQWFRNNEAIQDATGAQYTATAEGAYKVQVPLNGKTVFSNTLNLKTAKVEFTGALSGTSLTLTASAAMSSYTWLSGNSEAALTPISSATNAAYTATVAAQTKYYAVKATKGGCEIQSPARGASSALFAKPVISVSALANSSGKICLGTLATLSVPAAYATYAWYLDNGPYYGETNSTTTTDQTGSFRVDVTPAGWPEISISSATKKAGYYNMLQPGLTGAANYSTHCPGESIKETLSDEGYTYTWYLHKTHDYTEADKVTPTGYAYTFIFSEPVFLTVTATNAGCETKTTYRFNSYNDAVISMNMSDYDQEFLCDQSTVDLIIDPADEFTDFKWYKNSEQIDGETGSAYTVTAPGAYHATARPKACATSLITSDIKEIKSYTDRKLEIYSDKETMCEGEKATLTVPDDWKSVQWFEKSMKISNTGYVVEYIPVDGAGATNTLEVSKFTTYLAKAKHQSCPDVTKTWSEPLQLRPSLNPDITVQPWEGEPRKWHKAFFDSIPNYVFCDNAPLSMSVNKGYDTYEWYMKQYTGDGGYAPGDKIADATADQVNFNAFGARWYTARVTSGNCVGYSDAVLIDTYVHVSPAVAAIGTAELCGEDDTLPLSVAFTGDWVKYAWYDNGELIPDTDNDTLIVKQPGAYTVTAYPEACPHIGYSSGLPVVVKLFPEAAIVEEGEYIYATPWEGYYTFQWYFNDQPLDVKNGLDDSGPLYTPDTNTNQEDDNDDSYMYKRRMRPGVYKVYVSNFDNCSSTSLEFSWTITGTEPEKEHIGLVAHPNPTSGIITLKGLSKEQIETVAVTSAHGQPVPASFDAAKQALDLSALPAGVYVVEVTLTNKNKKTLRVLRN